MARKTMFGTSAQPPTPMADLGSIVRLDPINNNTSSVGFVLYEALQLEERPVAQHSVEPLSLSLFPYTFQVFHHHLVSIKFGNNVFTDVVVMPSHEPSFSSRDFFQQSLCGTSAFGLKFTTQILEFSFDLLDNARIVKPAVTTDGKVVHSEVNAQNNVLRTTVLLSGSNLFREREQEKAPAFFIHSEQAFLNIPSEVFSITGRDVQFEILPRLEQSQTEFVSFEPCASWEVIPNRASFDAWFSLGFLYHTTRLLDTGNSQLAWQGLSEPWIDKGMQFDIVHDLTLPSLIDTELQGFSVRFDSTNYLFGWINSNLCSDSCSHNTIKPELLFKCFGNEEETGFLPTINCGVSALTLL